MARKLSPKGQSKGVAAWHVAAAIATVLWLASGCSGNGSEKQAAVVGREAPKPVTVAEALVKEMPVNLQAVGTVEAFATVTVRAQVEGQLVGVHLQEGQCVQSGHLLFSIDPKPYEVQLKQVQANLARDKAQLENARALLSRYTTVVEKGYVSKEKYDQAAANVAALTATLRADEAAVENAQLQLSYCTIRSPIDGCAGEVFVHRGNLVKANDSEHPLVVIRQIRPLHIGFSVPEKYLAEIKKHNAGARLTVFAEPPGGARRPARGELAFIDNSVNTSAGTIRLKGVFSNADQAFWPGQYVNVILQLASQANAVVVPSQAVQNGQQGQYVFVLSADQTAELRPVGVERVSAGWAVIARGVTGGEKVVTDGQLRLFQGAKVKILDNPPPASQEAKKEARP